MDAAGLKELFSPFGPVEVRRMFGGAGVYADDLCFAIEARGEVYIKVDAETQSAFEAAGSSPFVYEMGGKPKAMGYWRLVAEAYDDTEALRRWAGLGLAAARRAAAKKSAGKLKASARSR
jgi:DNA transformation protein